MAAFPARFAQSLFAEALCTFIFGFTVYSSILNTKFTTHPTELVSVSLGIAFSSIVIIYTFADHALCHFNPAITLAAVLCRKLGIARGLLFIVSQVVGFICAALMAVVTFPGSYMEVLDGIRVGDITDDITSTNLFFSEFTMTGILVFVVFMVGINALRDPAVSLYGDEELPDRRIVAPAVIGLTLGAMSLVAVKTSGSTFNPGIIFAPMILSNSWEYAWQYYVAQFTGGFVGALIQVWLLFK